MNEVRSTVARTRSAPKRVPRPKPVGVGLWRDRGNRADRWVALGLTMSFFVIIEVYWGGFKLLLLLVGGTI